jgi:peptidoglycan hydrolase CwlO-like protein
MLKKIGFAALAVVAGLFILNSTHLGSYAKTAWHKAKKTAKGQVPLEFQLESARTEIAQLIPDMKNHIQNIAQETQVVRRLKEDITLTKANLTKQREHIFTLKEDLKRGEPVVYNDKRRNPDWVSARLAHDLASCQRCEKDLDNKEKMLEAKETALEAAREQLTSMKGEKEKLEVLVSTMEADLKTLRLAQTRSQFHLDDSRLSQIKARLEDIRDQMRAQQTAYELHAELFPDTNPVEPKAIAPSKDNVIKAVEAYLGDDKADSSFAAQGR